MGNADQGRRGSANFYLFIHELLVVLIRPRQFERVRQDGFPPLHARDDVGACLLYTSDAADE